MTDTFVLINDHINEVSGFRPNEWLDARITYMPELYKIYMSSLKRMWFCEKNKAVVKRTKVPMPESLPAIKVGGMRQTISLRDKIPCRRQLVEDDEDYQESEVEIDLPVHSGALDSLLLHVGPVSQVENLSVGLISEGENLAIHDSRTSPLNSSQPVGQSSPVEDFVYANEHTNEHTNENTNNNLKQNHEMNTNKNTEQELKLCTNTNKNTNKSNRKINSKTNKTTKRMSKERTRNTKRKSLLCVLSLR